MRIAYKILIGKPEGKGSLEKIRYRQEDNIKGGLERIKVLSEELKNIKTNGNKIWTEEKIHVTNMLL